MRIIRITKRCDETGHYCEAWDENVTGDGAIRGEQAGTLEGLSGGNFRIVWVYRSKKKECVIAFCPWCGGRLECKRYEGGKPVERGPE